MSAKNLLLLLLTFFISMHSFGKSAKLKKKDVQKLCQIMAGEFHNEVQSKEDKNFPHTLLYFKPIWKDEINGYWFYTEQYSAKSAGTPLSQHVYHIYKLNDTTIECKTYDIKSAALYAGAWNDNAKMSLITIDSLIDREGCSIFLNKRKNNVYSGSTRWGSCNSNKSGAVYASTEIVIYKKKIVIWDRAWNDKDKQVWGSVKGGYHFIKKKKLQ